MNRIFAIVSFVTLVVLAIAPSRDFFREWRTHQSRFESYRETLGLSFSGERQRVRQIWNRDLDRVDRCVSCHLGLQEEVMAEAPQPFRTHPRMYHDSSELGCTICHDGQGLATSMESAAGLVGCWDKPLLPQPFMEASCGRCHLEAVVREAPILTSGRHLLVDRNCRACHEISGIAKPERKWLSGLPQKLQPGWLERWLRAPQLEIQNARMPDFQLKEDEIVALVEFLTTFDNFPNDEKLASLEQPAGIPPEDELLEQGGARLREARCISCHTFLGKGGSGAVDLGKIASKVTQRWLDQHLENPKRLHPEIRMPRYGFSTMDRFAVTQYLLSEYVDWDLEEQEAADRPPPTADLVECGQELFARYNCSGCHRLFEANPVCNPGPDLTRVGARKLYEIEFGESDVTRRLPAYLNAKLTTPRVFGTSMRMPTPALDRSQRVAVTTALLSLDQQFIPKRHWVEPAPAATYQPQGDWGRLIERYECLRCHVIWGRGRLVATDLSCEGSQVREAWLRSYFRLPYSLRPSLTVRMPNLFMSEAEIQTAVGYITIALRADRLEGAVALDDRMASEGSRIIEARGCMGCHQLDGLGGYVGPPLDSVEERLQPGWTLRWLQDPQGEIPGTREPDHGFSQGEAAAVASFLLLPEEQR